MDCQGQRPATGNPAALAWPVVAGLLSCFWLDLAYLFLSLACFSWLVLLLGHVLFLLGTQVPRQPLLHVVGRLASCLGTRLQIRRQPFSWLEPMFLQGCHDAEHPHRQLPRPFTAAAVVVLAAQRCYPQGPLAGVVVHRHLRMVHEQRQ